MKIRPYLPTDRDRLYEICVSTGAGSEDAAARYTAPSLLGDAYVGPYLEIAPDLAWVADLDGDAAGYVLGTDDTWSFHMHSEAEWWPALRKRYPQASFPSSPPDEAVVSAIHHPETAEPAILARYPAHFRLDLLPALQGLDAGQALIAVFLSELTARGIVGVHVAVSLGNVRAMGFYQHLGFSTVAVGPQAFTLGKRLDDH